MSLELLTDLKRRYGSPSPAAQPTSLSTPVESQIERAFVVHAKSGRTVITTPLRELALVNEGFLYLHGRFVEADRPNANGAMWTTADLELGQATVAGGPLNWLHDDHKIVGSLMDGRLVSAKESAAAGQPDIGTHIASTAAMWGFLFPGEAKTIESAAADGQLYYSMECLSKSVACIDAPNRPGCGEQFSYADYNDNKACAHLRERSSVRRFVDPYFLGGAVIVPPVQPGWANASVDVVRQAAAEVEKSHLEDSLTTGQARDLAAAILTWANR